MASRGRPATTQAGRPDRPPVRCDHCEQTSADFPLRLFASSAATGAMICERCARDVVAGFRGHHLALILNSLRALLGGSAVGVAAPVHPPIREAQ